mmetsp:Transcript_12257/g.6109  ORF Transcript_12257/g.6109 Transcript_12257/m.6109 type:complete len:88 (-) Transcript_12257:145-408(-)
MLVFDVTKLETLDRVQYWIKQLNENVDSDNISLMLVGNKIDLPERVVGTSVAKEFAKARKCAFAETSALTGENVEAAFMQLIKNVHA